MTQTDRQTDRKTDDRQIHTQHNIVTRHDTKQRAGRGERIEQRQIKPRWVGWGFIIDQSGEAVRGSPYGPDPVTAGRITLATCFPLSLSFV